MSLMIAFTHGSRTCRAVPRPDVESSTSAVEWRTEPKSNHPGSLSLPALPKTCQGAAPPRQRRYAPRAPDHQAGHCDYITKTEPSAVAHVRLSFSSVATANFSCLRRGGVWVSLNEL